MAKGGLSFTGSLSVQGRVFLSIRKSIMNLTLLPGTATSASEISSMMKVSRTPVREAFIRLEREGLVNIIPQKETTISRINFKRVWQEQFLRESLELAALKPFFRNCSAEHLFKLRKIISVQREKASKADYVALIDCDDAFHRLIFSVAGQPLSWETVESMNGHYRRCRLLTFWVDELSDNIMAQHEMLVNEMENGNFEAAKQTMKKHLRKLSVEESLLIEKFPDYFESD